MPICIVAKFTLFGYLYFFEVIKINLCVCGVNLCRIAAKFPQIPDYEIWGIQNIFPAGTFDYLSNHVLQIFLQGILQPLMHPESRVSTRGKYKKYEKKTRIWDVHIQFLERVCRRNSANQTTAALEQIAEQ